MDENKKKKFNRKTVSLLKHLYYIALIGIILTLATMIYQEARTSHQIDMSSLLEGEMPVQSEVLVPFLDDVDIPLSFPERNVIVGINKNPTLSNESADWNIRNPISNAYVIAVEVVTKGGERIYSSGSIPPGSMIELDAVSEQVQLRKGTTKATAYILAYDRLRYEYAGVFTVDIEVSVL